MNAERVGELLKGCNWVGIPFAGGMCEVPYITARTIAVNDLHRGIIDLARTVDSRKLGLLQTILKEQLFHPGTLENAQERCFQGAPYQINPRFGNALTYFTIAWMTRSGTAGTDAEQTGKLALRWEAGGGDSVKRYHSAIDSLPAWAEHFKRCEFTTLDCFEFLDKCKDREGHAVYADPPFFGLPGKKYTHNCGVDEKAQRIWHENLETVLFRYKKTRVVVRAYDIPFIRGLYREEDWTWHEYESRKQTNGKANEVLIVRN